MHEAQAPHPTPRRHVAFKYEGSDILFEEGFTPESRIAGAWDKPAPTIGGLTLACRFHVPWYALTIAKGDLDLKVIWLPTSPRGAKS